MQAVVLAKHGRSGTAQGCRTAAYVSTRATIEELGHDWACKAGMKSGSCSRTPQHGDGGVFHDVLSRAAKEQIAQPSVAVRGHNDESGAASRGNSGTTSR